MNEFLRKLRDLTERMARNGATNQQINEAVRRLLSQNPTEKVFPDIRDMKSEEFVKQFGASEGQIEIINVRIAPMIAAAEKASKNFNQVVVDAVQKGLKEAAKQGLEGDFRVFAREALKGVITKVHHAETQILTASAALDRAATIESERLAGGEWFRYVGPGMGARSFCAQHVGRVYHISEIMNMSNGQGLSVMYHCGGYNCRHRWDGVSEEVAREERSDWFKK